LNIIWFRNDLRVTDNPALWHGTQGASAVAVFFLTPEQWRRHHMSARKVKFILQTLAALKNDLNGLGIPLMIRRVDNFSDVKRGMLQVCLDLGVKAAYWNDEYPVDERRRDRQVEEALVKKGVAVHRYHDRVLMPPGTVLKSNGKPYQVFTPFKKALKSMMANGVPEVLPAPEKQTMPVIDESAIPGALPPFDVVADDGRWPAGEKQARRQLSAFVDDVLDNYHTNRDLPAVDGTSCLSPYLAVGSISPQQCLLQAMLHAGEGAATWINELIWRDFYQHVAWHFTRVCKHRPFKPETDAVQWRDDRHGFERWCQGLTGVPLVDAGMRQLRDTGWMHNRVRMVVAMFLSKNLLIDWRWGERFFMESLIDGEFCANNGGWQWSASTGTDAVPYFRIFNPFTQGERFDPEARYIKCYVPELKDLAPGIIHSPVKLAKHKPDGYPSVMVDLSASRRRAIAAFKAN
jgi:deoxyribodipyrimidine photo-lyase